jgi:hypothetical protein
MNESQIEAARQTTEKAAKEDYSGAGMLWFWFFILALALLPKLFGYLASFARSSF